VANEFVALAARGPLLLALDDLQWADRLTLRVLDHLQALLQGAPHRLWVVATLRPPTRDSDLAHSLATWRRTDRTRFLPLGAFDDEATRELVESLTGMSPATCVLDLLHQIARGNPLFVRELLVHLDDSGRLGQRDGMLWTDAEPTELDLPSSLRSMIGLLLQKLSRPTLATVHIASCIGTEFSSTVLAHVAGLDVDTLLRQLDELEHCRILTGSGKDYAFRHPLVRHGVYESLSNAERMRTHGSIARALLKLDGTSPEGRVAAANHAALAFDFFGSELSVEMMIHSCEDALHLLAWDDTIRFCEAVLDRAQAQDGLADPQRMRLHYLAGTAYHHIACVDRALRHFDSAADLARSLGDRTQLGRVVWERDRVEIKFGRIRPRLEPETAELELLIETFEESAPELAGRLMTAMSMWMFIAARFDDGRAWTDRACRLGNCIQDGALLAHAKLNEAVIHWEQLDPAAGLRALTASSRAARAGHEALWVARSLQRIPLNLLMLGRIEEVPKAAQEAREASAHIFRHGELTVTITAELGASLARGDVRTAGRLAREGVGMLERSVYVGASDWLLTGAAYLSAILGDWEEALQRLDLLVRPGAVFRDPAPYLRFVDRYRLLLRAHRGESAEVARQLMSRPAPGVRQSIDIRRLISSFCVTLETAWEVGEWSLGARYLSAVEEAFTRGVILTPGWPFLLPRMRACATAMAGDHEAAIAQFHEAIEWCDDHDMQAERGKALLCLARLYQSSATATQAQLDLTLDQAETALTGCSLVPYLETLDRLRNPIQPTL